MDNVERAQILSAFELFANMMKQCQYVTPSGDFTEILLTLTPSICK